MGVTSYSYICFLLPLALSLQSSGFRSPTLFYLEKVPCKGKLTNRFMYPVGSDPSASVNGLYRVEIPTNGILWLNL